MMSRLSCHFVLKTTSSGMAASLRRLRSLVQLSGRYKRQPSTVFPCSPTGCKLTATWQFPILPNVPEYCLSTPTECFPCLGKPVSSITQTGSGSNSAVMRLATRSQRGIQSHGLCPTNCCRACTFPSAERGQRLDRLALTIQQESTNINGTPMSSFAPAHRFQQILQELFQALSTLLDLGIRHAGDGISCPNTCQPLNVVILGSLPFSA